MSGQMRADQLGAVCFALVGAVSKVGGSAWLVGGCVRDILRGHLPADLDVVVVEDFRRIVEVFAADCAASVAPLRATTVRVMSRSDEWMVDISQMQGNSIAEDLAQRDFTINAMSVALQDWQELLAARGDVERLDVGPEAFSWLEDPFDGFADLRHSVLRVVGTSSLRDGPSRLLRGARFIASLALVPEEQTTVLARAAAPLLLTKANDLLRDELGALLATSGCASGVQWLAEVGALEVLFSRPLGDTELLLNLLAELDELRPNHAASAPTSTFPVAALGVVKVLLRDWVCATPRRCRALMWAAFVVGGSLSHREANAVSIAQTAMARPGWAPEGEVGRVLWKAVELCDEALFLLSRGVKEGRAWRWYFEHGTSAPDAAVIALCIAWRLLTRWAPDHTAEPTSIVQHVLESALITPQQLMPQPLLTGRELIDELHLRGGPVVGELLARLRRAQLDGLIATRDDAQAFVRRNCL